MKGIGGVQMQVHPKFQVLFKEIQTDRIKNGKDKIGELSHKRLSLTLYKRIIQDKALHDWILNVEIDKDEI